MKNIKNGVGTQKVSRSFGKFQKAFSLAAVMLILTTAVSISLAATSGPNSPSTVADVNSIGTIVWTNPGNASATDNAYAVAALDDNEISHYLKAGNFGFSLPTDAAISGIKVDIEKKAGTASRIEDYQVKIVKADGSLGTENKANSGSFWTTADTYVSYGGTADTWGESWSAADINDADFGVAISAYKNSTAGNAINASIDHIRITVTYATNNAPSAPTLVSPTNGYRTSDNTPTLSAKYIDVDAGDVGTTHYRIASSADNCLTGTALVDSGTSSVTATNNENTTWNPSSSIGSDATYYWCAQNDDGVLTSAWTSMGNFVLDTGLPTVASVDSDGQIFTSETPSPRTTKITFSEDMSVSPVVTITPTGNSQVVTNCGDADAKTFCFNYFVPFLTSEIETVNISAAKDLAGNQMLADNTHTFEVDTLAVGTIALTSDGVTYSTLTPSPKNIKATFSIEISNTPTISISPDGGAQTVDNCGDADLKTFCFNYTIPTETKTTETVTVSGAEDDVGNVIATDSSHTFAVDTLKPEVVSLDSDGLTLTRSTSSPRSVKITFSQDMSVSPVVTTSHHGSPFTVYNCGDADAKTFCFYYTIPTDTEFTDTVNVTDGKDLVGNQMDADSTHLIDVDTLAPTIVSVDSDGQTFSTATPSPRTIKATFSEDISNTPSAAVNPDGGVQAVGDCGDFDAKTFCFNYDIDTYGEDLDETITFSGAQDAHGNVMVSDSGHTFVLDTLLPTVDMVDSDGQTFNSSTTSPKTIKVTFEEHIFNPPTISIAPDGGDQTVNNCGDGLDTTFCFNYVIPASTEATETMTITDAIDHIGNTMAPDNSHTFKVDNVTPTFQIQYFSDAGLTVAIPDSAILKAGVYYLKITANEALFGTPVVNIDAQGTVNDVVAGASAPVAGNEYVYTRSIAYDSAAVGSVLEDISISGTDVAGNSATAVNPTNEATKATYTDTVVPTVTDLSTTATEPTNVSPIPVSVTFSEKVGKTAAAYGDLDGTEFTITNGVVGGFANSGDDKTYTFSVTPFGKGAVKVDLNANAVFDAADNGNTAAVQLTRTFDSDKPSVVLSSTASLSTKVSPIPVSADFDEDVTGFDETDVSVSNGSVINFSGSGSAYTFAINPAGQGTVTVQIAADRAEDGAGNKNNISNLLSRNFDSVGPGLLVATPVPTFNNINTPSYSFTTDEDGEISYSGDCQSTLTTTATAGLNTVTFDALADGLHDNCAVVVKDAAGNNSNTLEVNDFTVDTKNPTVILSTTSSEPTNAASIPFTATFSEDVSGLLDTEIYVTNGIIKNLSGLGSVYTFEVSPNADGEVKVKIPANVVEDVAGNLNTTESNEIIRNVDTRAPQILSAKVKDTNSDGKMDQIELTFDEDLADTAAGGNGFDVNSSSNHGVCNNESADPSGKVLLINFFCSKVETSVADMTLSLVPNDGVRDALGNQVSFVALTSADMIDDAAPVLVGKEPTSVAGGVPVDASVKLTFSEPMQTVLPPFALSDDDSNSYLVYTWTNGNRTVEATHADWSFDHLVKITVNAAADDVGGLPMVSGPVTWSILTKAEANHGSTVLANSNVVDNNTGLDLSGGASTAGGGNILIDSILQPLSNVNTGDLSAENLNGPQMVGDQIVTVNHAVTLHDAIPGPISLTNAALTGVEMQIPDNTTLLCDASWDGTIVLRDGTSSGNAPTGFSIGNKVVEAGSPACVVLLDQPVTLTMAGVTGLVAFRPAGSSNWVKIEACGGTYAAPTLDKPVPFKECSISNGTDTKIVTYHLTSFGSLVTASSGGNTAGGGKAGGSGAVFDRPLGQPATSLFGKPACSGMECLGYTEHGSAENYETNKICSRNALTLVPFEDISSHWAKEYIQKLYRSCVVEGKNSSSFAPESNVTKAELVKIILKTFKVELATAYKHIYQDVNENDWYAPYIMQAAKLHLIKADQVNKFVSLMRPNLQLSRAEALDLILKAKGVKLGNYNSTFSDVHITDAYYPAVAYAQAKGLLVGKAQTLSNVGQINKLYTFEDLSNLKNSRNVENLKTVMAQLDYYRGEINGNYDQEIKNAVKAYQTDKRLPANGEMSKKTTEALLKEFISPKVIRYFEPSRLITRAEIAKLIELVRGL